MDKFTLKYELHEDGVLQDEITNEYIVGDVNFLSIKIATISNTYRQDSIIFIYFGDMLFKIDKYQNFSEIFDFIFITNLESFIEATNKNQALIVQIFGYDENDVIQKANKLINK